MILIPRKAQTSSDNFLSHLGTDNLTIFQNNKLKYGQFQGTVINELSNDNFHDILQAIASSQNQWEIRQGTTTLLDKNQNQLQLAVGTERLQQGVKEGEFSLGQALTGYWLIEDELPNSNLSEILPYYQAMKQSIELLSTVEADNNQDLTNSSLIEQTSVSAASVPRDKTSNHQTLSTRSNQNLLTKEKIKLDSNCPTNEESLSDNKSSDKLTNSEVLVNLPLAESIDISQSNQFDFTQHQAFLHRLFSQLSQRKKLRYSEGKAFFTINGETWVAQLNEQHQWEYVSGSLSPHSLNQIQYELKSSSSSQSFDLTL